MGKLSFRDLPRRVRSWIRRSNRDYIHHRQGSDPLAARARLSAEIASLAQDGRVAIVYGGIDCDCSRWDNRVSLVPATHWAVARWVDSYMEGAEGPQWWHLSRPSAAPRWSSSRDLALEAFEDGHPHIVYY